MDCDLARRLLAFARPGAAELDAPTAAALDCHLSDCPACCAAARAEQAADQRLARAMRAVTIPADARRRLDRSLIAARGRWWRRIFLRSGVVVVLALGGVLGYLHWSRSALDPGAVAQAAYEQSGLSRDADEVRDGVTDWLRGIDRSLRAPDEFNYKLLAFYGRSEFAGLRSVPTLVFARGGATARVFVVRQNALRDLGAAADQPVEVGGSTVAVRRYTGIPGWLFIVVTSGAAPDAFVRPAHQPPPV